MKMTVDSYCMDTDTFKVSVKGLFFNPIEHTLPALFIAFIAREWADPDDFLGREFEME